MRYEIDLVKEMICTAKAYEGTHSQMKSNGIKNSIASDGWEGGGSRSPSPLLGVFVKDLTKKAISFVSPPSRLSRYPLASYFPEALHSL